MIYAFESTRYYNPAPHLLEIKDHLIAINSADDQVNTLELGLMEKEIKKVKNGKFILLHTTDKTSGHGTHSDPTIWGDTSKELLETNNRKKFYPF